MGPRRVERFLLAPFGKLISFKTSLVLMGFHIDHTRSSRLDQEITWIQKYISRICKPKECSISLAVTLSEEIEKLQEIFCLSTGFMYTFLILDFVSIVFNVLYCFSLTDLHFTALQLFFDGKNVRGNTSGALPSFNNKVQSLKRLVEKSTSTLRST